MEVNFKSLYEMITSRNSYNLNISCENIFTIVGASSIVFLGIKCSTFVNMSITTRIESWWNLFFGKPTINSIEIIYHFCVRISCGYKYPLGCWFSTFTFWYSRWSEMAFGIGKIKVSKVLFCSLHIKILSISFPMLLIVSKSDIVWVIN